MDKQNLISIANTLGFKDITSVTKLHPDLVLKSITSMSVNRLWPVQLDHTNLMNVLFGSDFGCGIGEYGGIWIPDSECKVNYLYLVATRLESGGLFGTGTLMFDLDSKPSWKPELLSKLSKTNLPWALCETPNGYHIHYLGEYWYPGSAEGYANTWRGDYLTALNALLEVGIEPDLKHVAGSLLQCRCYLRLQPKLEAAYSWKNPIYVGIRTDLPKRVYLDAGDEYYASVYPGHFVNGRNYSQHAMDALSELQNLRLD